MLPIGLNHMTVPTMPAIAVLDLAERLGCVGVEYRNDLKRQLFDGADPQSIKDAAGARGLRILALAEVKSFNIPSADLADKALTLIQLAIACGSEALALIPHVAAAKVDRGQQRRALLAALQVLRPMLEDNGLIGLIEPLGFVSSSLRHKSDAVAVLEDMGAPSCFKIVHDTFHHHIAGGGAIYPDFTGLVHISGIAVAGPGIRQMADEHRVLVGPRDRLRSVDQLRELQQSGYQGAASIECFSRETHEDTDPAAALAGSIEFIASQLTGVPA